MMQLIDRYRRQASSHRLSLSRQMYHWLSGMTFAGSLSR
jgi:hypothetical protein